MIATQGQTKMSDKVFLTADQLLRDSYDLAAKVLDSGFRPTFILGVWRGGTPVGIAVQELLSYCGLKSDHISIRTSSYRGIDDRSSKVRVYGLNYVVKNINRSDSLLIVDDVHDTGLSIKELIKQIKKQCRKNAPREIRFATVYYKPERSKVKFEPDYFIHETDDWLVFPHELEGLSREELIKHKPGIDSVLDRLLTHTD
jgi:hypoxanthine phosphoribosyltransferase